MLKIFIILLISLGVKIGFYSIDFFQPVSKFPFFSNVHTDFEEILEGISWKKIVKTQRKQLSALISEIPENSSMEVDQEDRRILEEKLKFNPKHYANDYNLQHHPIIIELLSSVYEAGGKDAVFALYLLLDLLTCFFLYHSYKLTKQDPPSATSFMLVCLNPLSIAAVCLCNTYLFMYFFFSFILADTMSKKRSSTVLAVFGGLLIALDPHYLVLILLIILYRYTTVKERLFAALKVITIAAMGISYVYFASGMEAFKSVYVNLLFITDGNESMSMVWYFYIICFKDFLAPLRLLVLLYPYILLLPAFYNVKFLEHSYNEYCLMPIDPNNQLNQGLENHIKGLKEKPEGYRKFLTKDEENLNPKRVENYHLSLALILVFIYFTLTKEYLVSSDFIIIIPFIPQHWKLLSQSPFSVVMLFILTLSYFGQFAMFISWQMRIIANVNNYWTQIFINSIAWVITANIITSRVKDKAKEFRVTTDYFYKHIKQD
ncbi:unnamed protein product [Moneuplotes crassus]|uniref:GPI transamidase subunit PIG-U n=1 Tax=Euplotes crassus TaxID=5936 RepID=A0AAD1XDW7_EUPCR|nr:unnamed protein product [Moneuplotes crassus]